MDALVAEGSAKSRAALVELALKRERRRRVAERDAAIYSAMGEDPELKQIAAWRSSNPLDMGDLD